MLNGLSLFYIHWLFIHWWRSVRSKRQLLYSPSARRRTGLKCELIKKNFGGWLFSKSMPFNKVLLQWHTQRSKSTIRPQIRRSWSKSHSLAVFNISQSKPVRGEFPLWSRYEMLSLPAGDTQPLNEWRTLVRENRENAFWILSNQRTIMPECRWVTVELGPEPTTI